MLGSTPSKGNVQQAARNAVANVSEFGRAFEGGAGRDIRMEGFVPVVGQPRPGTGVVGPRSPKRFLPPLAILALVVLLAS